MCFKTIKLTKGKVAIVDEDDYKRLSVFKWHFGQKNKNGFGYAQRRTRVSESNDRKTRIISMHQEILKTDLEVDHKNSNTLDNRKENLRPATRSQQMQNTSSRKNSSSKYVGVHIHKLTGKWRSQIRIEGKVKSIGLFRTQEEARIARSKFIEVNNLERFKR